MLIAGNSFAIPSGFLIVIGKSLIYKISKTALNTNIMACLLCMMY